MDGHKTMCEYDIINIIIIQISGPQGRTEAICTATDWMSQVKEDDKN